MSQKKDQLVREGQAQLSAGNAGGAATLLRKAVRMGKPEPNVLYELARAESACADYAAAQKCLAKAIRLQPDEPAYHALLAIAYMQERRLDEAMETVERALALNASHPDAVRCKAELLRLSGRGTQAYELLESLHDRGGTDDLGVVALARLCPAAGHVDKAVRLLESIAREPSATDDARIQAMFLLGETLDKAGRYHEAFPWFQMANEHCAARFDLAAQTRSYDEMIEEWSPEAYAAMPRARERFEEPVFILGMPRSGTSLVEQIAASHPAVYGAGERHEFMQIARNLLAPTAGGRTYSSAVRSMTVAGLDRSAKNMMRSLRKEAPDATRITDKAPNNFTHIGLISLVFPASKIVHCVRDPQDTCLSCYFHRFAGAYPYCYDLTHLGGFYVQYQRLMEHWKSVVDVPILDVSYEELVADQDGQSRRLIEFLGLEWDDACLRFHETERVVVTESSEQVRQPMYASSVKRRDNYAAHLAPLRAALGIWG
jgi:Flp pilus assembly protein TadD